MADLLFVSLAKKVCVRASEADGSLSQLTAAPSTVIAIFRWSSPPNLRARRVAMESNLIISMHVLTAP